MRGGTLLLGFGPTIYASGCPVFLHAGPRVTRIEIEAGARASAICATHRVGVGFSGGRHFYRFTPSLRGVPLLPFCSQVVPTFTVSDIRDRVHTRLFSGSRSKLKASPSPFTWPLRSGRMHTCEHLLAPIPIHHFLYFCMPCLARTARSSRCQRARKGRSSLHV